MTAKFGEIPNNIDIGAGQSIRRNQEDTEFEAYNPGSGGSFTTSHITTSVNPAVPFTTYLVDASAGNVTITLPNSTAGNTSEYKVILSKDTNKIIVTTVGGTQLIGDKTTQIIHTINGQLYLRANDTGYDIITDTRGLYKSIDITTDTDLSTSGFETQSIYHCTPSGGTITITVPDASVDCDGSFATFTIHGTGTVVLKTTSSELIEGLEEQTMTDGSFELVCLGDHYIILSDGRQKIDSTSLTLYSLNEVSAISDGFGGFYRETATSTSDSRYSPTSLTLVTPAMVANTKTFLFGSIITGAIQGELNEGAFNSVVNIGRNSGSASFKIMVELYHRTSAGVKTLIGSTSYSNSIDSSSIIGFNLIGSITNEMTFTATDSLVRECYGLSTGVPTGIVSVEGDAPSFTTIGILAGSISHNILAGIQQAGSGIANGHISDQVQTIAGLKTLSEGVKLEKEILSKEIATPTNPASGYNKMYFKSDGKLYKLTPEGVESEVGGGGAGLAWGATISGSSGVGLLTTISDSASAGTIGQSIVIGNTQTNAVTGLNINIGTSASSKIIGINITALGGTQTTGSRGGGIGINMFSSATQTIYGTNGYGIMVGENCNTNSSSFHGIGVWNENNSNGYNDGIRIYNKSTKFQTPNADFGYFGTGLSIIQAGIGGVAFNILGLDNINRSNGLVNFTLKNSQAGASIIQKIDLGTSAQGHTGLLVNVFNPSTSARGIKVDITGGTGIGIETILGRTNVTNTGFKVTKTNGNSGAIGLFLDFAGTNGTGIKLNNTSGGNHIFATHTTTFGSANYTTTISNNSSLDSVFFSGSYSNSISVAGISSTSDKFKINTSINSSAVSGTSTFNFNTGYLTRTAISSGVGGTILNKGSVLKLENVATQTAGTLTDTVAVLNLIQTSTTSNGGHIKFSEYTPGSEASVPNNTLWYNGTDIKFKDNTGTVYTLTKS